MEDHKIEQWTFGNNSHGNDVKMTRSGPDIRLTELEQQLEVAETRCGSLKSQLDYMKMLYQGVQPCSTELIQTTEQCPQIQPKKAVQSSPRGAVQKLVEDKENCQENTNATVEDVKYYQFLKEIHKMQEITRELDTDLNTSPRRSSKSPNITPRVIDHRHASLEKESESISAECRHTKQIRKAHIVLGSAAPEPVSIFTSVASAATSLHIPEVCKEHDSDNATGCQSPTNYSAHLKNDFTTPRNLTSRLIAENNSECGGNGLAEQKKDTRMQELVLKLSESMDNAAITVKRKRITKVEKKPRTGLCAVTSVKKTVNSKYEDSLSVASNSKSKRKKGKLRGANSKNTVMTRETNLTDRRDSKKRKQKGTMQRGYSSATHMPHRIQAPTQHVPRAKAEVVEIYHNNAVEGGSGSISVTSSKHSKHETSDQLRNNNSQLKKAGQAQICPAVTYQQEQQLAQQQQSISDRNALLEENDARTTFDQNNNEGFQTYSSRSQRTQNCAIQDSNRQGVQCCSVPRASRYYDPTITRNYELPTVASKLKKVNRSYFSRFNFRNIPFVVSTSVTPSHNLGLNIQQVLSIMKTRQPMASGTTPLLIRKMSRGIKPTSMLLDCINDSSYSPKAPKSTILSRQNNFVCCERPKTTTECKASVDETVKSKYPGCLTAQTGRLHFIPTMQTNSDEKTSPNSLLEEDEDMPGENNWVQQQESECICCSKKSKSYNKMLKQYTSRKSITGNPTLTASTLLRERQEEINIGDNEYNQIDNVSSNAKGIREVLINLHDQFEELNIAYEKLQEDAATSNDKSIIKQASALEKELNDKEEEINAVVGLYKEVLHLKQQVHSIHGKNSFVCIATSDNPLRPVIVPHSGHMRSQLMKNPMQIFGMRSKGLSSNTREPATATRLTGLLREIQSFQKQLLSL